jgi:hypothetical protein
MTEIIPKARIEDEARKAAAAGVELRDACPYPFSSEAGKHFIATYLLALPPSVKS